MRHGGSISIEECGELLYETVRLRPSREIIHVPGVRTTLLGVLEESLMIVVGIAGIGEVVGVQVWTWPLFDPVISSYYLIHAKARPCK
jgi:hypothetical protein